MKEQQSIIDAVSAYEAGVYGSRYHYVNNIVNKKEATLNLDPHISFLRKHINFPANVISFARSSTESEQIDQQHDIVELLVNNQAG